MRCFLVCIIFVFPIFCRAQEKELVEYLKMHKHTISWGADSNLVGDANFCNMLQDQMNGKKLLIYGEGGSHMLRFNAAMINLAERCFAGNGLKYFLQENSRSGAAVVNLFLQSSDSVANKYYPDEPDYAFAIKLRKKEKDIYRKSGAFEVKGVDFERKYSFENAMRVLMSGLSESDKEQLLKLAYYATDTGYLTLNPNKFLMFYKDAEKSFYKDSTAIKKILVSKYDQFKYIMTDPAPSTYFDNRNRNMAEHILAETEKLKPGEILIMDCGMAHSRRGKRDGVQKTMANILCHTKQLEGKVCIVHLYCQDCSAASEIPSNDALDFMKGEVLKSFQQAADSDLVLFDLSGLPNKYSYMRDDYGDLLMFARNQH